MSKPIIAIPADIRILDGAEWHAAQTQYLAAALKVADVMSFIVPAFEEGNDVDAILDRVDGLLVSGSATNVHPSLYGVEAKESDGPYDSGRDATSLPLIRRAIDRSIPMLAICRGIQELNVALGGTLASEIQEQPGVWDHRKPEDGNRDHAFRIRQPVRIAEGSCIAQHLGVAGEIQINSLHRQAIAKTAPDFKWKQLQKTAPSKPSPSSMPKALPLAFNGTRNIGHKPTPHPARFSRHLAMRCESIRRRRLFSRRQVFLALDRRFRHRCQHLALAKPTQNIVCHQISHGVSGGHGGGGHVR